MENVSAPSGFPAALGAAAVAVVAASLAIVAFGVTRGTDPAVLLRDPAAEFRVPVYAGALSYLGVALLCATSAITVFVAALLRETRSLFALVGAFTALLAFDDLFLLHEHVGPKHLGIPEVAFYALYAGIGLLVLRLLLGHFGVGPSAGLLVALVSLGLSAATDLFVPGDTTLHIATAAIPQIVIEDLFKLAGWAAWFGFWASLGIRVVSTRLAAEASPAKGGNVQSIRRRKNSDSTV